MARQIRHRHSYRMHWTRVARPRVEALEKEHDAVGEYLRLADPADERTKLLRDTHTRAAAIEAARQRALNALREEDLRRAQATI
jgi:hypothetical protein